MGCIQEKQKSTVKIIGFQPVQNRQETKDHVISQEDYLELKIAIMAQSFSDYKTKQEKIANRQGHNRKGSQEIKITKNQLANPKYNKATEQALNKIKHKQEIASQRSSKKHIMVITDIDENGQIKLAERGNSLNKIRQAISTQNKNSRSMITEKVSKNQQRNVKFAQSAEVSFRGQKLNVVEERLTEEDILSEYERNFMSVKSDKSTICSSLTSQRSQNQQQSFESSAANNTNSVKIIHNHRYSMNIESQSFQLQTNIYKKPSY
ncbi:UNKNOWN [Stylonychia lemnae]|uniref:Uncharacterized protein n=1 Tax=Stylonychia lemnae TaxID=5949 RepID=A0A078AW46_STYLE|nr:UNKNOWN [Stylonychia lemnae]|eukprot:CDW85447.1 UNKNOWN [Stylonychia lemnae]